MNACCNSGNVKRQRRIAAQVMEGDRDRLYSGNAARVLRL
jgi:hypothetical protein